MIDAKNALLSDDDDNKSELKRQPAQKQNLLVEETNNKS